ncbi:MAG: class I SAM-dependent methyltransferase, partial [Myxococcales bacterium]|nr:class I SAM-dependent methyltransferase [Myxococcales bacterium]
APPAAPAAAPAEPKQVKRKKGWYDDVFAEHYLFLYPPSWEETARRDAEFIKLQLGLPEGASILDIGCGEGRHAIELAKLGYRVTGLDNSLALLLSAAQNKELAGIEDASVEFIHGDMRRLPRDREYDAVICVGTTLGYFEEDQNRQCIEEMHGRLAPGGKLLLHVFNRDFVAPQLPARSWWQGKRCMVLDEAEMNFFANRLRVHRTIIFDDGRQYEHYMFIRAFTVQDLGKALSQLGMRVLEVSGNRDTRSRFYGSASPEIWIVAERKA